MANKIFRCSLVRRSDGTKFTIWSPKLEETMKAIASDYYENQSVRAGSHEIFTVYRTTESFHFTLPEEIASKHGVNPQVWVSWEGLRKPPVRKDDDNVVYINMAWLGFVGMGQGEGVSVKFDRPMLQSTVLLFGEMMKRAAMFLIENYAKDFSVDIELFESA